MGHRISLLVITEKCGAAGPLSERHGAGQAAFMSSAFHALCAGDAASERQRGLLSRLSPAQRAELDDWRRPEPCEVHGVTLHPKDAAAERTVVIELDGSASAYPAGEAVTSAGALTVGHPDMYWVVEADGRRVVFVGDMKRSLFTAEDGPDSLQLLTYMYALCAAHNADAGCCGIWPLTDGDGWVWGPMHDMRSMEAGALWARIREAALAPHDEYVTGPHCGRCYASQHCQEYLLPVADPTSALAPLMEPGGLTPDNAGAALDLFQRASTLLEAVEKRLKLYADQAGGIPVGGKVWKQTFRKPGEAFDAKRFREENPELAAKYMKPTPAYSAGYRMLKP